MEYDIFSRGLQLKTFAITGEGGQPTIYIQSVYPLTRAFRGFAPLESTQKTPSDLRMVPYLRTGRRKLRPGGRGLGVKDGGCEEKFASKQRALYRSIEMEGQKIIINPKMPLIQDIYQ